MLKEKQERKENDSGYIMLVVLVFVAISALIVSRALDLTGAASQTVHASKIRSEMYYESEESLALAANWLRASSADLVYLFHRNNFYNNFTRVEPSLADNEGTLFATPSALRVRGSDDSPLLSSDASVGGSAFPISFSEGGAVFDLISEFNGSGAFPNGDLRITLIDAIPHNLHRDYGDPALGNSPPETDFRPVFRLDSMTAASEGSHVYSYFLGSLKYEFDIAFFWPGLYRNAPEL